MDDGSCKFLSLLKHWRVSDKVGRVWGFDIGGANLKLACLNRSQGTLISRQQGFPLWRSPNDLGMALQSLTSQLDAPEHIVVTMTGEIADCYASKAEGVASIVSQCEQAFESLGISIRYYSQESNRPEACWLDAQAACENWIDVAAANWHAVSRLWGDYLSQMLESTGLIADLGSTTLDLTKVVPNRPSWTGSDWERIRDGRLVYTGARRSPLSMILSEVKYRDRTFPLAQELFATIHDTYLITGLAAEDINDNATADGRAATKNCAAQRIARLFCSDLLELPDDFVQTVAAQAQWKHCELLATALSRQLCMEPQPKWLLLLGEGESLLRLALRHDNSVPFSGVILSGNEMLGPECSRIMPAVAVAILA